MNITRWLRTIRFYPVDNRYVAADRAGWIPGSARTRLGMLIKATRYYAQCRRGVDRVGM